MKKVIPILVAVSLSVAPAVAWAQEQPSDDIIIESPITEGTGLDEPFLESERPLPNYDLGIITQEAPIQPASVAPAGVMLRALDKVSGEVVDFDLLPDQTKQLGRIQVTLGECRYPVDNPTGDAASFLVVRNAADGHVAFRGWMLASSPALNALDHPRYDVWVLRCKTE